MSHQVGIGLSIAVAGAAGIAFGSFFHFVSGRQSKNLKVRQSVRDWNAGQARGARWVMLYLGPPLLAVGLLITVL